MTYPTSAPLGRRAFTLAAAGLGAAALIPASAAVAAPKDQPMSSKWAGRALATYNALRENFLIGDGSGLYKEHFPVAPEDPDSSYEWPFSQAHAAVLDLVGVPVIGATKKADLERHRQAQLRYWADSGTTGLPGFASSVVRPDGSHGDFFYDDNEWVGLIDVQRHAMYGDRAAVDEAVKIFDLVISGWDNDEGHPAPGGVFWTQATWSSDRNTVSNMPGAELGLRLFQITAEQRFFDWSVKMYDWTNLHLQIDSGLYHDHLDLAGTVEKTIWSYNQGVPIGVNTLLWQITEDQAYLDEARRISAAAAAFYAEPDPARPAESRLDRQPCFFNSIYFKNRLKLDALAGDSGVRAEVEAYAERMWSTKRDAATGLFHFGDPGETQMIEQAAMVQILAVLAWPSAQHSKLY